MRDDQGNVTLIMERKMKVYEEFLNATRRLGDALSVSDMEEAGVQIRRREGMIRLIDRLDRQARRYRNQGPPGMASDIRRLLKQIIQINRECETAAEGRYEALRKAMTAARGYACETGGAPKLFNIQT